jgi:hypothetical protein
MNNAILLTGVSMDDMIITIPFKGTMESFKAEMKTKFQMNDSGFLSFYLGIEVQQHNNGISLVRHTSLAHPLARRNGRLHFYYTPIEEGLS